jgi:RNA polymerase sigma factor (sigma-70 family)
MKLKKSQPLLRGRRLQTTFNLPRLHSPPLCTSGFSPVCRTRYRQEFLYGFRFGERFEPYGGDFDGQARDRPQRCIEEPVESLTYSDLTEALSKLSREHHEVIEQLYWHGRTETEVAKSIGLSQRAVSKRKQRALKVLRAFLRTK